MRWATRLGLAAALAAGVLLSGAMPSAAKGGHGKRGYAYGHGHGHGHGHGYAYRYGGYYGPRTYWGGPRVVIGVGPLGYGAGYWWGAPFFRPAYAVPAPAPVVIQQPVVYIERPAPREDYWYYCPDEDAYYPEVATCSEPWVPVAPRGE